MLGRWPSETHSISFLTNQILGARPRERPKPPFFHLGTQTRGRKRKTFSDSLLHPAATERVRRRELDIVNCNSSSLQPQNCEPRVSTKRSLEQQGNWSRKPNVRSAIFFQTLGGKNEVRDCNNLLNNQYTWILLWYAGMQLRKIQFD